MKKIKKFLFLLSLSFIITNCGDDDGYNVTESQRGPKFDISAVEVIVPQEDVVFDIPISTTFLSTSDRVFGLEVLSSTGGAMDFTVLDAVIPAGELEGVAQVSFDFSAIEGEDIRNMVLKMLNPEGAPSNEVTITYFKEILCNDLNLTIISDVYATETYFSLESADGTVIVDRFFPFSGDSTSPQEYSVDFVLADGDYVLKIGDLWGDGQVGTGGGVTLTGSYSLTCDIITHASGEGAFENAVSDSGIAGNNPIVEVTEFTVNP